MAVWSCAHRHLLGIEEVLTDFAVLRAHFVEDGAFVLSAVAVCVERPFGRAVFCMVLFIIKNWDASWLTRRGAAKELRGGGRLA